MPTGGEYYQFQANGLRFVECPHSGSSPLDCYRRPGGYLDPLRRTQDPSPPIETAGPQTWRPEPTESKSPEPADTPQPEPQRAPQVRPNPVPEPNRNNDLPFATNLLFAGAAAGLAHGPVARAASSLARENIAHSISTLGSENLTPPVVRRANSMSHWWEERFGVDDSGKLLNNAVNKEIELNALLRQERERSVQNADTHLEHFGSAVANTWKRAIDSSLNETEKVLFAGYQFINSRHDLRNTLQERGVIPGKFFPFFRDPEFIKDAKAHGPELMARVTSNFSPADVRRLKDYNDNFRIATKAAVPPVSQREIDLISDKKQLYELLKIPRQRKLEGSLLSVDAAIAARAVGSEGLGPILTSAGRSGSAGGLASLARGAMFATGVQLTSDLADRLFMPDTTKPRSASLYTNAIGTSLALCMEATPAVKVATALGIGLLGCAIDAATPSTANPKSQTSNDMSPAEATAIGIASGIPIKAPSLVPRLGLIGASIIVGKLFNEFSKTKL